MANGTGFVDQQSNVDVLENGIFMFSFIRKLADNRVKGSYANRLRVRRFRLFDRLIADLPRPLRIIDVGGTSLFWEQMGFAGREDVEITLVNLQAEKISKPGFQSFAGDARDLSQFDNQQFDLAFSNSVIEHVGDYADQEKMVREMQRVARFVFLQTPNRYFPLEPHFLFPFFQFLPVGVRVWMLRRFRLGWYEKTTDRARAEKIVRSIRLLTRSELKKLFPGAVIHRERLFGMVKSFVVVSAPV